jgi:prevent-host-death family protein
MKRISALTMRRKFGEYLDLVAEKGETVVIERGHRPMVALIPADRVEDYERFVAGRERREEAVRRMDELRAKLGERLGSVDVVALVRDMRDSR